MISFRREIYEMDQFASESTISLHGNVMNGLRYVGTNRQTASVWILVAPLFDWKQNSADDTSPSICQGNTHSVNFPAIIHPSTHDLCGECIWNRMHDMAIS